MVNFNLSIWTLAFYYQHTFVIVFNFPFCLLFLFIPGKCFIYKNSNKFQNLYDHLFNQFDFSPNDWYSMIAKNQPFKFCNPFIMKLWYTLYLLAEEASCNVSGTLYFICLHKFSIYYALIYLISFGYGLNYTFIVGLNNITINQ